MAIDIYENIYNGGTQPNLDAKYGPYDSVEAADDALSVWGRNVVGLTVGILGANDTITEYWYQGNPPTLVPKQTGGGDMSNYYTKSQTDGAINDAIEGLTGGASDTTDPHVEVEVTQTNGLITEVIVTTDDIASATQTAADINAAKAAMKSEIIGNASAGYDTLGELETAIKAEETRAKEAEQIQRNNLEQERNDRLSLASTVGQNTTNIGRLNTAINNMQGAVELLDGHKVVAVEELPTDATPPSIPDSNVIYRLVTTDGDDVSYEDYMYNENNLTHTPVKIANYPLPGLDETATKDSEKLLTSGKVFDAIQNEAVFDISVKNAVEGEAVQYTDLVAALGINGANVPRSYRAGGMSVKFIKTIPASFYVNKTSATEAPSGYSLDVEPVSIDTGYYAENQLTAFSSRQALPTTVDGSNVYYYGISGNYTVWTITKTANDTSRYEQYRLMTPTWSPNVSDWQGVDNEAVNNSENLITSGAAVTASFNQVLTGKGNYVSDVLFRLPKDRKFRIYLLNPNWNITGLDSNVAFSLSYKPIDNTQYTNIVSRSTSQTKADYYDFDTVACEFYRLYIRAVVGEKVYFKFDDITANVAVDSTLTQNSDNPVSGVGMSDAMAKGNIIVLDGNDNTTAFKNIKLSPNRAYTIYIDNPAWGCTNIGNSVKFRVRYNNGSENVDLIYKSYNQELASRYNFRTVDGVEDYYIGARADVGQTLVFRIEPNSLQATDSQLSLNGNTILEIEDTPAYVDDYNRVTKSSYIQALAGYNLEKIDFVTGKLITIPNTTSIGDTLDITPVDNSTWRYAIVDCSEGDYFVVSCSVSGSRYAFCYIDSNNEVVELYTTRPNPTNVSSIAPANAAKLVISDHNSNRVSYKGRNISSRIKELGTNIVKAFKNDGIKILKTSTGYRVKITAFRIKNLNGVIYGGASSNFDFEDSNSYLLANINTMEYRQETSFNSITNDDIVLLSYTAGVGFTGGLLFGEYIASGLLNSIRDVVINAIDIIFNHSSVKWQKLTIRIGSTSYTINASEYNFGGPVLIFRPSTEAVVHLSSVSSVVDGDIVLLIYRNNKFVGGKLIGYYNAQIRDIPKDAAHLNVYRKALQQSNLKWTPKAEVVANEGTHPAGEEVTGVPYSSVKEKMKSVGRSVSIHTFMTAVNDVHSLLYTEKVGASNSQSAYGITYHGTNCISYFGSVCSNYNAGMLGINSLLPSYRFKMQAAGFTLLPNQDEQSVEVGDVIVEPSHVLTCIKVERDEIGSIKNFTMAEQAAPINVEEYSPYYLGNRRKIHGGVWARYSKLYNNTEYTPSPFVLIDNEYLYNVGDVVFIDNQDADGTNTYYRCKTANSDSEFTASNWVEITTFSSSTRYGYGSYCVNTINSITNVYKKIDSDATAKAWNDADWAITPCNEWASVPFTYNDDIVTFAGDRAAFGLNDQMLYINYVLGNYTAMELFKEDTLIQTIPLSSGYQIDVKSYITGAGKYRARLKNSSEYSRFTYFEIIDNSVTASFTNDILSITSNTPAYYFSLCPITGSFSYGEDLDNTNSITKTRQQLIAGLAANSEEPDESNEALYCRLLFQGEYGQVASEMTEIMSEGYNTGAWSFVHEGENISLGEISETANVALAGDLQGHSFMFDVFTDAQNVSVNVVPVKGEIRWLDTLPQTLSAGHIYQINVVNGIDSIKSNA